MRSETLTRSFLWRSVGFTARNNCMRDREAIITPKKKKKKVRELLINVKNELSLSFTNEWNSLLSFDFLYSAKSCNKSSVIANGHLALTSRTAFRLKRNMSQVWDRMSSRDNENELFVTELCRKKRRINKTKTNKAKTKMLKTNKNKMNVYNSRF